MYFFIILIEFYDEKHIKIKKLLLIRILYK